MPYFLCHDARKTARNPASRAYVEHICYFSYHDARKTAQKPASRLHGATSPVTVTAIECRLHHHCKAHPPCHCNVSSLCHCEEGRSPDVAIYNCKFLASCPYSRRILENVGSNLQNHIKSHQFHDYSRSFSRFIGSNPNSRFGFCHKASLRVLPPSSQSLL